MVKRIIFDIDNTLILFKDDFIKYYAEIFPDKDLKKAKEVYDALEFYEDEEDIYSEEAMLNFLNRKLDYDFDINMIKKINKEVAEKWVDKPDKDIISTFEYLSKKYEIYALTNWFTDAQKRRLDKFGILKYFTKVIGTDMVKIKPNKEAYLMASNGLKMEDCLFIGDSPKKDLDVPYQMGAKVIHFDNNYKNNTEYPKIREIKELKNIL